MRATAFSAVSTDTHVEFYVVISDASADSPQQLQLGLSQHAEFESHWTAGFAIERDGPTSDTWSGRMPWTLEAAPALVELTGLRQAHRSHRRLSDDGSRQASGRQHQGGPLEDD